MYSTRNQAGWVCLTGIGISGHWNSVRAIKALIVLLMVFSLSPAQASSTTTGKVGKIGGQVTGQAAIYFGLDSTPTQRPACSTHLEYFYVLDPGTDEGRALYSMLLSAKAQGIEIAVHGADVCALGQPMEAVSYWYLSN